jgi:hypothetical protein
MPISFLGLVLVLNAYLWLNAPGLSRFLTAASHRFGMTPFPEEFVPLV